MKLVSAISLALASAVSAQLVLESTFKNNTQKNIAFFAHFGGSSHYNWVLNVVDELGIRGHDTYFLTGDADTRHGKPYSHVKTVSIGKSIEVPEGMTSGGGELSNEYPTIFLSKAIRLVNQDFERDFNFVKDFFIKNNIDLAICDNFSETCLEAAKILEIPYIMTCTVDPTDDSGAPYVNNKFTTWNDPVTEFQPLMRRFINKFINPLRDLYYLIGPVTEVNKRKAALGIDAKMEDPTGLWKDALKLINTVGGYTPARPLGPLVEFVGPILPRTYTPLTGDLQQYLDKHQNVAYVAFGQHAEPTKSEAEFILTALLENLESGVLDGVIWATANTDMFPSQIKTSSGKTYKVTNDGISPDVRFLKWAPQTAVLLHPTTVAFVSHGGVGSWFESMYAGKRMIMFPFFADQPGNALMIERNGIGGILKASFSPKEAAALVKKVVEDDQMQSNVQRFQALTQIHSKHGVSRAADLVEEAAYTHVKGKLLHRESADRRMSYLKGTNLDLYLILIGFLSVFSVIGYYAATFATKKILLASKQKLKVL